MSVQTALEAELRKLPSAIRDSSLAKAAQVLASTIDGEPGARDLASCVKEYRATMADLKVMADQVPRESDPVDQFSADTPGQSGATISYLPRRSS